MNTDTNFWDDPEYPWGEDLSRDLYKIEYDERKTRENGAERAGIALPMTHQPSIEIADKMIELASNNSLDHQRLSEQIDLNNSELNDTIGGMSNNNASPIVNSVLDSAETQIKSGKPEDLWTCGIDRQTGKPKCTEYPNYYNSLDQDELNALQTWENNTSEYIKKLQRSNDVRAHEAWMNVNKMIPDLRTSKQSNYDPTKKVAATNLNGEIRYYDIAFDPGLSNVQSAHITSHEGWHSDNSLARRFKEAFQIADPAKRKEALLYLEKVTDQKAKTLMQLLYDESYRVSPIGY